jgi:2-keto-4-pentenoate hydratase/2-oxohepta-3-ene-1,7-dioic acid hydratase in catechol pathway
MKLARLGEPGSEIPVVVDGDDTFDLRSLTSDIDGPFLATGLSLARAALAAGTLPRLDGAQRLRTGAPIAKPGAVICIGQNYAAHARESGAEPPTDPVVFFKHPNTVIGPFDEVLVPLGSDKTDWEVELAVVIGRRARYVQTREEAMACIAGFAVSNDVSERAFQLEISGGQWSKGKCCETFNPLGPVLVTADELDPAALQLRSWVNGEARQDSSTADMIFDVATLVMDLSQVMVLDPGDLINTGTPEGVALSGRFPYLAPGDVMACEIDGIGRIEQKLRAAS